MPKGKGVNLQYVVWGFSLGVLAVAVSFSYYLYHSTGQEIAEQFNTQQLILAQEAATGIEEYLGSLRRNMRVLKELSLKGSSHYQEAAQIFYQKFRDTALADIWLLNAEGRIQSSITHPQLKGHDLAQKVYFLKAQQAARNEIYTSGVFKLGTGAASTVDNKWIILSLRLDKPGDVPLQQADILIFLISLNEIVDKFILSIRSGKTGYAWVLDENGTLLHHPEHPEMIDRSIFAADKSCQGCHRYLFKVEKGIVEQAKAGKTQYVSATGEDKLIAYPPIYLGERVWSIVVTAPHTEVTLLLRESFHHLLLFLGVIMSATLTVTVFVLRINAQRLAAENKARYTRQLEKEVAVHTHEIKQEKQKLDDIVSAIGAQLSVINKEMQLVWINEKVIEKFGPLNPGGRQNCYQLYYQRRRPCPECPAQQTFRDGQFHQAEQVTEKEDGKAHYQITSTPIYGPSGQVEQVLVLTQDITLQKLQEQNLIDSKKMLAMGQLAVGLAHDLGNPLSIIAGSSQFCLKTLNPPPKIKEHLQVITRNVSASNKVIQALLQFARPSEDSVMEAVSLAEVLQRTLLLLSSELSKDQIKVIEDYPKNLPSVHGDKGQLEQVFVNVILNSLEALPKGGEIKISAQTNRVRQQVYLSFADNGPGFDAENLESVFEPFFTTRVRGVGLGLSISKRIIESHQGTIKAQNQDPEGAKLTICLPFASRMKKETVAKM